MDFLYRLWYWLIFSVCSTAYRERFAKGYLERAERACASIPNNMQASRKEDSLETPEEVAEIVRSVLTVEFSTTIGPKWSQWIPGLAELVDSTATRSAVLAGLHQGR
tara:strand:- start:863 stop:1183 length:321 start_codon:yes stop_codon:yes gene_type:complete